MSSVSSGFEDGGTLNAALETERLILRRMSMAGLDDLMGIFSDPEAMRYYPST